MMKIGLYKQAGLLYFWLYKRMDTESARRDAEFAPQQQGSGYHQTMCNIVLG